MFGLASTWDVECLPYLPINIKVPLKFISSLIKINNITEIIVECPCLQE
jgi:hypothetical protein